MAELMSFLKTLAICATVFFVLMLVLLALPKSRLRGVGIECLKYAVAGGLFLLAPLPIDLLPDVLPPVTYLDDVGYVWGGIAAMRSARADRRRRLLEEDCDAANAALMARHAGGSDAPRGSNSGGHHART